MLKRFLAKWMGRSSRRFGHQSAIRPMRRWRGNGRLYPEGGKTSLRTCERSKLRSSLAKRGAGPAPTSKHPKHRVARPTGRASTRQKQEQVPLEENQVLIEENQVLIEENQVLIEENQVLIEENQVLLLVVHLEHGRGTSITEVKKNNP